jgi:hypothetical protein
VSQIVLFLFISTNRNNPICGASLKVVEVREATQIGLFILELTHRNKPICFASFKVA